MAAPYDFGKLADAPAAGEPDSKNVVQTTKKDSGNAYTEEDQERRVNAADEELKRRLAARDKVAAFKDPQQDVPAEEEDPRVGLRERVRELETDNEWLLSAAAGIQAKVDSIHALRPQLPQDELARVVAEERWEAHPETLLTGVKVHQMSGDSLEECRKECVRRGCRAFHVLSGRAFIREGTTEECVAARTFPFKYAHSYILKK
eukprot:TRINITY_DN213_c0_g1_i2.p1 TRINITY_DN213_c0_g1~~TRINITY_DN213_c0_g1_i2.p1  ORF type:complete len:204 (+),score=70.87 TRINITY_DN213_c0_g1_i2:73-684(+)